MDPAAAATVPAVSEMIARDAILAWFRGEFAAANAIIDALCAHLTQICGDGGGGSEYAAVFTAIHSRRFNWIPVLHMQKYFSISDVSAELRRVSDCRRSASANIIVSGDPAPPDVSKQEPQQRQGLGDREGDDDGDIDVDRQINGDKDSHRVAFEEEEEEDEEQQRNFDLEEVNVVGVDIGGGGLLQRSAADPSGEDEGEEQVVVPVDEQAVNPQIIQRNLAVEDHCAGGEGEGDELEEIETNYNNNNNVDDHNQICSNHQHYNHDQQEEEYCVARPERIKITKGFVARESVKGHMVNVVKGLKLYEDIFMGSQLSKISHFVNDLRIAGQNGQLSGETFIFFNKQLKGNKREIIQLGVPLFQSAKDHETTSSIEPIPPALQTVIEQLVLWRLIPESKKPNSVIINFFDEEEYSQPYYKPPHLDNPISTLIISETTMTFGRMLVSDHDQGNYKGSLTLPLRDGSLLVMRGNSADMARHVVCPSSNRRVIITFVKVRPSSLHHLQQHHQLQQPEDNTTSSLSSTTMTMVTKAVVNPEAASGPCHQIKLPDDQSFVCPPSYGGGYGSMVGSGGTSSWGIALRGPVVIVAQPPPPPPPPTTAIRSNGTGVFLPWTVGSKRHPRHLPPRILKRRLPSLQASPLMQVDSQVADCRL